MLVTIGADCHMKSHTLVAVDPVGRNLGQITVGTNTDGHLRLLTWAEQFDEVIFALEDCRHVTRRLERDLLRAGQKVLRVPTKLMGEARRIARQPGKSDPIDAEAVAIAALRHPDLPTAQLDGPARDIKLLSDHRRDLVMQRTRSTSATRSVGRTSQVEAGCSMKPGARQRFPIPFAARTSHWYWSAILLPM
ncbi:hypothetical protein GCM10025789_26850 [Tessaracoccus lubricantis]|uniref:Transposase IS110-like N-terminal domain-containing protein n=1 Tax=Tessaracoccus lubricantis TaxID=545543 RepID=A0ABP9FLV7_9ACTN